MADPFIEAESTVDRAEFLDRYKHRLYGIVFEATMINCLFKFGDSGKAYEDARRKLMQDCDKWLAAIYDQVAKPGKLNIR